MLHSLLILISMHPLLLLCLICLPAAVVTDCDNPIYKRFSANHTACKDENPKCNKTRVSSADSLSLLSNTLTPLFSKMRRSESQNRMFWRSCGSTTNTGRELHQERNWINTNSPHR